MRALQEIMWPRGAGIFGFLARLSEWCQSGRTIPASGAVTERKRSQKPKRPLLNPFRPLGYSICKNALPPIFSPTDGKSTTCVLGVQASAWGPSITLVFPRQSCHPAPMRRRFRIVLIICLVAAAGGLIWFAIRSGSPDDPIYHGRRLSSWLDAYISNPGDLKTRSAASEAVYALGTNAFPCLLKLAVAEDSPNKRKLWSWLKQHHVSFIHVITAQQRQDEAALGFHFLRVQAKPALPALSKLLADTNSSQIAGRILGGLGIDGLATLTNALTNANWQVRQYALGGMSAIAINLRHDVSPADPVEKEATTNLIDSFLMGSLSDTDAPVRAKAAHELGQLAWLIRPPPKAAQAIPALIHAFSDKDINVRADAAVSLGEFGTNAVVAIPVLIHGLSDTNIYVRYAVTEALGYFGTNAAPAVPILVSYLTNSDTRLRRDAAKSLNKIDPDAAAKAGVK
jgi:HEAT repeat protein